MSIGGWLAGFGIWIVLSLTVFGLFEARGLRHADRQGVYTLSFVLYKIGSTFPLTIAAAFLFLGLFIGGLTVHLTWHWCPPGSTSEGMIEWNKSDTVLSGFEGTGRRDASTGMVIRAWGRINFSMDRSEPGSFWPSMYSLPRNMVLH